MTVFLYHDHHYSMYSYLAVRRQLNHSCVHQKAPPQFENTIALPLPRPSPPCLNTLQKVAPVEKQQEQDQIKAGEDVIAAMSRHYQQTRQMAAKESVQKLHQYFGPGPLLTTQPQVRINQTVAAVTHTVRYTCTPSNPNTGVCVDLRCAFFS